MTSWQNALSMSAAAAETASAAAGPLVAVAASLLRCSQDLSQWSLQELTSGLGLLALRHLSEELLDTIPSAKPVTSRKELLEMLHWLRWAMAAYEADTSTLSSDLNIPAAHVMRHVPAASHGKPAYVLARDEARRVVVVSVRGTHSASDVLTDLTLDSCAFQDGFAHRGMLECATWLHSQLCPKLTQVAVSQGWRITVVGHSLGAGTAALLALLLKEEMEHLCRQQQQQQQQQQPQHLLPQDLLGGLGASLFPHPSGTQGPQAPPPAVAAAIAAAPAAAASSGAAPGTCLPAVECWAFACPPVVSKAIAVRCSAFTRSIVLQHDIVPRLCPEAFDDLRMEVMREMKSVPALASKAPPTPAASGSSSSSTTTTMSMLGLVASATAGALLSQATSPAEAAAQQPIKGTPAAAAAAAAGAAGAGSMAPEAGAGAGGWSSSSSLLHASFKSLSLSGAGTSTATPGAKAVPAAQGSAAAASSSWLSVAGAVASAVRDARTPSQSGGPPSSSTDRSVNALTRAAGSVLERRLCVPGVPYHILRHIKTEEGAPPRTIEHLIDQERQGGSGGVSEVYLFLRERQGMDERGVATGEEAPSSLSSSLSFWPSRTTSSSSQTGAPAASSSYSASSDHVRAGGPEGGGASATFKAAAWATAFTSALQTAVSSSVSGSSGRGPSVLPTERYSVVKGDLGGSAFKRLVIATSVLSDHSCKMQGAAIINALQWG